MAFLKTHVRLLATASLAAAVLATSPAAAETIVGLTTQGGLVLFDSATPGTVSAPVAVTGLGAGETLLGIDRRPATGQLFGISSASRLYTLDTITGAATAVGAPGAFTLSGTSFGFDFNPTVDRIRVTSNTGQNLRLNPNTGALAATDTPLAYQAGDANAGTAPSVVGSAYTNNFSGAASTQLFDIDANLDILALQVNPNAGLLQTVGPLGINAGSLTGFDISGPSGIAYLVTEANTAPFSNLYRVNLGTGAASLVGTVGGGLALVDIAALAGVPEPGTWATMLAGFGLLGWAARRRRALASA
ncbi:DUF4394 domain-containing protein [Sphingomonas tabacisoli]|uniref:DUF4394 domain-containing protein n=1 Tax=Sphingomonas tabacisoli TaxID=2249466 RepID=A0ABW4HXF1_9SPHN